MRWHDNVATLLVLLVSFTRVFESESSESMEHAADGQRGTIVGSNCSELFQRGGCQASSDARPLIGTPTSKRVASGRSDDSCG